MVWLPVFGIFNMRTAIDACDCKRGLYGHRKRVCTDSGRKIPCRTMRLSFKSDALPTQLSRPTFRSSELRVETTRTQIDKMCQGLAYTGSMLTELP